MINIIPVLGWLISLLVNMSLAIPFWIIWTNYSIGAKFAYWLPPVYQAPGFWETVGVFMVVSIIKLVFVPKLLSVSNDNDVKR